jgi:hypothetical protein
LTEPPASASPLAAISVPALTVVPPPNVLTPESVTVVVVFLFSGASYPARFALMLPASTL